MPPAVVYVAAVLSTVAAAIAFKEVIVDCTVTSSRQRPLIQHHSLFMSPTSLPG
jgi:hypothetical protein